MWFVYILRCADGSLYIGETGDLPKRLAAHNKGDSIHTSTRRPVTLAYFEELLSRAACLKRERQLKRWTRAKKEALIAGDEDLLNRL